MIPERILGLELLGNKKCLVYGWSAVFWKRSGAEDGGTVFGVCWPYLGLPCQMWFLWWGTIRYLYHSFTSVVIRFRCAVLYGALTDISHLAAVSRSGALLTYRRICVYSRVLCFHFLTSLFPRTLSFFLYFFYLAFLVSFPNFVSFFPLHLHPSLPALGPTHNGSPVIPKDKTTGAWR